MGRLLVLLLLSTLAWSQTPPADASGPELRDWLKRNFYDGKHRNLGYSEARVKMYNIIDNQDSVVVGVYGGYREDKPFGGDSKRMRDINAEHTVPQSFFGRKDPMKSDIHHLFPTFMKFNSIRGSKPFCEIDDRQTDRWLIDTVERRQPPAENIEGFSESNRGCFEPRESHKGNTARAVFYFYTMYPAKAGDIERTGDIDTLYAWHLADPPDAAERARNDATERFQGNRNPYIDQPELLSRAWSDRIDEAAARQMALALGAAFDEDDENDDSETEDESDEENRESLTQGEKRLELEKELKLAELLADTREFDLLDAAPPRDFEASGVAHNDGVFYVAFDNLKMIAAIRDKSWGLERMVDIEANRSLAGETKKLEGLSLDPEHNALYAVVEAKPRRGAKHSRLNGRVYAYAFPPLENNELELDEKAWLGYNFQRKNKGFEGLAHINRDGKRYLLALCEGNDCDGGPVGARPGNGKIKVFERQDERWVYIASLDLPELPFADFSGLDVRGSELAVVSQEHAALWVGRIDEPEWRIVDAGHVYAFPKNGDGETVYCNVEGVAWIEDDLFVVVSDRRKPRQPSRCGDKDQSIHIFRLK